MVSPKHGAGRACWNRASHSLCGQEAGKQPLHVVLFLQTVGWCPLNSGGSLWKCPPTNMKRCTLPFSNTLAIKIYHHISLFETFHFLIIILWPSFLFFQTTLQNILILPSGLWVTPFTVTPKASASFIWLAFGMGLICSLRTFTRVGQWQFLHCCSWFSNRQGQCSHLNLVESRVLLGRVVATVTWNLKQTFEYVFTVCWISRILDWRTSITQPLKSLFS